MSDEILTSRDGAVYGIQINRPEKKNALSVAMYEALVAAFAEAEADDGVRVIFVTGTEGCFSSGNDVMDFLNAPPAGASSPVFQFLIAIAEAKKPVVAAVAGDAIGIGTTMLLHFEVVYAASSARFRLPFVNLGLCPEAGSSLLIPHLAGYHRAAELLLFGDFFDAVTAEEAGIVTAVLPQDDLLDTALARAQQLAAQPPEAVRLTKALLKRATGASLRETMAHEGACFAERLRSPEFAEAIQALLQKRPPDFSTFK